MNIKYYLFKAIQVANWAFMYCWDHKLTDQKNSHKISYFGAAESDPTWNGSIPVL